MQTLTRVAMVTVLGLGARRAGAEIAIEPPPPPQGPNATAGAPMMREPGPHSQGPGRGKAQSLPAPLKSPRIAAVGNTLAGTWSCTGTRLDASGAVTSMTPTLRVELGLDAAWIVATGLGDDPVVRYWTFDEIANQWTQLAFERGGQLTETQAPDVPNKWTWTAPASAEHPVTVRYHDELVGKTRTEWAELHVGGTWVRSAEAHCKRG